MFTDKAKEKFEVWLIKEGHYGRDVEDFYDFPPSMQWGVIQDFADSLGYNIVVCYNPDEKCFMWLFTKGDVDDKDFQTNFDEGTKTNTRQQARAEAIKKLNKLINTLENK